MRSIPENKVMTEKVLAKNSSCGDSGFLFVLLLLLLLCFCLWFHVNCLHWPSSFDS